MTRPCLDPRPCTTPLVFKMPAGACDCHAHVFGPYDRYPLAENRSYTPSEQGADAFIAHLDRLGMARGMLVTASAHGTENRPVLEALRMYPDRLRGVAVVRADVTDAELDALDAAGVCGARFNLFRRDGKAVYRNGASLEDFEALAPRLAERGWHAQIWIHAPDLPALRSRLLAPGVGLVIDHMGRMSAARGVDDPGFRELCRMVGAGEAWVKISGADRLTARGEPYDDVAPFMKALVTANPDRLVWGSDWPHINYFEPADVPDDGVLANCLHEWLGDADLLKKVLVDNPTQLYRFGPT